MKYTDQRSKTVYEAVDVNVPDGDSYFHTWNEDDEPEYYYRLHIRKDLRFDTLYDIAITKVCNYDDKFFVTWREISEDCLPFELKDYFSGEEKIEKITKEQFNKVKQEVINKLK